MAKNLPVIPTVYGATFDEFNTGAFTGWPSATDPYESGSRNTPTNDLDRSAPHAGLLAAGNSATPGSCSRSLRGRGGGPSADHPHGRTR